jgi:hypothetical protein
MPDQPLEPSIVAVFTRIYDELRSSAVGELLEPLRVERMLPLGVQSIRDQNPQFTESQFHEAIYKGAVLEVLRFLDVGEELIHQVLNEYATTLN